MTTLHILLAAPFYFLAGILLAMLIDGLPRFERFLDRLSVFGEVVTLLFWPLLLPLRMWRHGHARR